MSNQPQNTQKLPSTPDWSKAPEGYDYFAINKNGVGYFSKKIPCKRSTYWESYGKEMCAGNFDPSNWENSRQQRPKSEIHSGQPTIDWAKAPEWANYFTIDKDRMAFWHEKKPDLGFNFWNSNGQKASVGFVKGIYDWKESLQQRPKIETLTVSLNTDISGYLAGKNSFITGLVDLLLARMAKEERFSDDENVIDNHRFKDFDIVTFIANRGNAKSYAVVVNQIDNNDIELSHVIYQHDVGGFRLFGNAYFGNLFKEIRTITELEAVEFRTAMEAIYG